MLGEVISGTKEYNLTGELAILNDIKENSCFLAENTSAFNEAIEQCNLSKKRNPIWREWALPDYKHIPRGFNLDRKNEEHIKLAMSHQLSVVNLTSERFKVPEVLFRPSDIGMQEGGLPELL